MDGIIITPDITDWPYYTDCNTMRVLIHLTLMALHQGDSVRVSVRELGRELGMSYRQCRTAIKHLTDEGIITVQGTRTCSVVTFQQWHSLRHCISFKAQQATHNESPRPTAKQQHTVTASADEDAPKSAPKTRERPARLSTQHSSGPSQQDISYIQQLLNR